MLRKHLLTQALITSAPRSGEKVMAAIATVLVTSERPTTRSTAPLITIVAQGAVAGSPPRLGNSG